MYNYSNQTPYDLAMLCSQPRFADLAPNEALTEALKLLELATDALNGRQQADSSSREPDPWESQLDDPDDCSLEKDGIPIPKWLMPGKGNAESAHFLKNVGARVFKTIKTRDSKLGKFAEQMKKNETPLPDHLSYEEWLVFGSRMKEFANADKSASASRNGQKGYQKSPISKNPRNEKRTR